MAYSIDVTACPVVPVSAFYGKGIDRARSFSVQHIGLSFYMLPDCRCFGDPYQAIAPVANSGTIPCIFQESCPYLATEFSLAPIIAANLDKQEVELEEAVPLYAFGSRNLWHWTLESLPKLLALEDSGYTGLYIIPASDWSDPQSVIRQSLDMFGIAPERLAPSGPVYRVKRLILPQRLSGFHLKENMPLCEYLRERLVRAAGTLEGTKRLYIRRIGRRKVINEEEVLNLLAEFGFSVMTPEEYSQKEQWRTMTNVECSVMAHGANSTLTMLQKPRSAVVELFSNQYVSYNNMHAVRLLKLRYVPLVEELDAADYPHISTPVSEFLATGLQTDVAVNTSFLKIVLESLLE